MLLLSGSIQRRITGQKKEGKDKVYHRLIVLSAGTEYGVLYEDSMIPSGRKGESITLAVTVSAEVGSTNGRVYMNYFAQALVANDEIINMDDYRPGPNDRVVEEW